MKKLVVLLITATMLIVISLVSFSFRNSDSGSGKKSKNTITGTWKMDSYKYGTSSSSFTVITPDRPHIKLITENRFLWVTYDSTSKKILESAGGSYTLDGDNYVESIDYGFNMDSYLGSKTNFKIKVEDGMFYVTGLLDDGYKIEEIWQKVE